MTALRAAVLATALLAAGCMPYARGYLYLEGPGIAHEAEACGTGPPVWAVMTAGKAKIRFTVDPGVASRTKLPMMSIVAPQGTRVELAESKVFIGLAGSREAIDLVAISRARDYPSTPAAQQALAATLALERQSGNAFYRYEAVKMPELQEGVVVELPAVIVDGERFVLPVLTLDRRASAGFVPLNC